MAEGYRTDPHRCHWTWSKTLPTPAASATISALPSLTSSDYDNTIAS